MENEMNNKELRSLEQMIAMLGDMVQEAMTVPLSGGKCIVERERVLDILEDIRVSLPDELKAFAHHGPFEAVDTGDTVANLDDGTGLGGLDLGFQLVELCAQRRIDGLCGNLRH